MSGSVECAREALGLAEQFHQTRAIHNARNALAQLAARGGLENPVRAIRAAVAEAYADRGWYDLWPTVPVLAEWWARNHHADNAAVVIGYLDAHHLASVDNTTRSLLGTGPDIDRALVRGTHLDRDQIIAYILEHLSTDP